MNILYDDKDFVVFEKTPGIESEKITYRDVFGSKNILRNLTAEDSSGEGADGRLFCVHRLDKEVGGVTVYAKNEKTAAILSGGFANRTITKTYLALVEGIPEPGKGTMEDLLFHDRRTNKTYVVKRERKGVKKALLSYEVVRTYPAEIKDFCGKAGFDAMKAQLSDGRPSAGNEGYALCEIRLQTGRTHQIRIQFASRKMPLAGDRRYGSKTDWINGIALWSFRLQMPHPVTGEKLTFVSENGLRHA